MTALSKTMYLSADWACVLCGGKSRLAKPIRSGAVGSVIFRSPNGLYELCSKCGVMMQGGGLNRQVNNREEKV